MHTFIGTTFRNVLDAAVIYLEDPNPRWAGPTDCIEWPCTAPENVVLRFEKTQFSGSLTPIKAIPSF